jgi:hypothetical protein
MTKAMPAQHRSDCLRAAAAAHPRSPSPVTLPARMAPGLVQFSEVLGVPVVLSINEKSQIQALDRTRPGLPMKPSPRDDDV